RWPRDWSSDVCSSDLRRLRQRNGDRFAAEDGRAPLFANPPCGSAAGELRQPPIAFRQQRLTPIDAVAVRTEQVNVAALRPRRDRSEERRVGKEGRARE